MEEPGKRQPQDGSDGAQSEYIFRLTPIRQETWLKNEVIVNFTGQIEGESIPRFNCDGNSFTPSFHSGIPEAPGPEKLSCYIQQIVQELEEAKPLFQPKPSKTYCGICQELFADYIKHIKHPRHIKKVSETVPNMDFEELALKVVKMRRRDSRDMQSVDVSAICGKRRIIQDGGFMHAKSLKNLKEIKDDTSTNCPVTLPVGNSFFKSQKAVKTKQDQ